MTHSVKGINENQLASDIKYILDKKEGEVERDGLNHCHIQGMAGHFALLPSNPFMVTNSSIAFSKP